MDEIEFDCLYCGVHVYGFGHIPAPTPTRCSTCEAIAGIPDADARRRLKRILDHESLSDLAMVVRHDENGNIFIFADGLTPDQAYTLESRMHGHKQWYSVYLYQPNERRDMVERLHLQG